MTRKEYNEYVKSAIIEGEDDIMSYEYWLEHERMIASVRQQVKNYPTMKANPTQEDFIEMQKIK